MPLSNTEFNFLENMISIPSVGGNESPDAPYGEIPLQTLNSFLETAKKWGFKTENIDNRVGYVEYGEGEKLFGIVAHLDVVPAGEGWSYDPFKLTVDNGSYYGRGIVDDKGPAIASLIAMKRLMDSGFTPDFRVRLILGTDEERTCSCVEHYAATCEIPTFAITPDAEFPVIFAEKGILHIKISNPSPTNTELSINGGNAANMVAPKAVINVLSDGRSFTSTGKMAHASKPNLGVNAIDLIPALLRANDITFDNIPLIKFIEEFDKTKFTGCNIVDDSGELTTNSGILKIDSDEESLIIDIRYPVTSDYDSIIKNIIEYSNAYNLEASVINNMDPIYKDKNSDVIANLTNIWKKHMPEFDGYMPNYSEEFVNPVAIGGGTYARHIANTVAFGVQTPWTEDQCHQADEHYSIKDYDALIEVIKDTITSFK